ncbi:YggT family protein [Microbacteriaceae bacterium SG_E_30_P1]|uniref:YggT family protein n=1 Tax=Antiquaquibacter oligotrophicus TaxID=2880260 RepID=A0ABT6KLE4_9MICO|nr:YggT family protein [Antiquaquibacter oligotrophicus]MDH6180826.1 YggT family protein [Antiquaquibacter oligotrophicus]UDF13458.1 YggT family protein [Antiquaquibacter oligotrophicus]
MPFFVSLVATVIYVALVVFFILMWGRFVLDLARMLARQWRPKGLVLVLAEFAYLVTDPPIRLVRRVIPPLRIGGAALDFAWSIVMLVVIILMSITLGFMN